MRSDPATAERRTLEIVDDLTIDGRAVKGAGAPIDVFNPATEDLVAQVSSASLSQVDDAFAAARRTFDEGPWPRMRADERSDLINSLADRLEENRDQLLAIIVTEVGTPIALAESLQVGRCIASLRVFAELAKRDWTRDLGSHPESSSASMVAYRPAGVVAAICAYNYPLALAVAKVGPALATGCTSVVLPSPRTPLATLFFGRLVREAGFPPGVVNVIVGGPNVGVACSSHSFADRVSFTGSVPVGKAIMRQAAENVTNVNLELGGKSPAILLPGFPIDEEHLTQVHMRYLRNAGQGCTSPTRILVPEDQCDAFAEVSRAIYGRVVVGDPWDRATQVGPVIRPEHRDRIEGFIDRAIKEGGHIVVGGGRPSFEKGWYVNPTLLGGLRPGAEIAQNEVFGPVAVVLPYRDLDHAIEIANGTQYGLAAYVLGPDTQAAIEFSQYLRAGAVYVNGSGGFRGDAPMGGMKASGIGRHGGEYSMHEFLEPQHIQWATS